MWVLYPEWLVLLQFLLLLDLALKLQQFLQKLSIVNFIKEQHNKVAIFLPFDLETSEPEIGSKINQIATEVDFIIVIRNFEAIENKLFDFLEKAGNSKCFSEISFEKLLLVRVVRVYKLFVDLGLELIVTDKFAGLLNLGQVGDHRMQEYLWCLLILEESMSHQPIHAHTPLLINY